MGIILANRTIGDQSILIALGEQLEKHHKTVAAHICYLLAKVPLGAIETPGAKIGLLSSTNSVKSNGSTAIHLTEIFEAIQVLNTGSSGMLLHFQQYKFNEAIVLADLGEVAQALKYIDALLDQVRHFPITPRSFIQELNMVKDRINVTFNLKAQQQNESWFSQLGNNFTGAALGRGIETLMNTAVGVERKVKAASPLQSESSLFPLPQTAVATNSFTPGYSSETLSQQKYSTSQINFRPQFTSEIKILPPPQFQATPYIPNFKPLIKSPPQTFIQPPSRGTNSQAYITQPRVQSFNKTVPFNNPNSPANLSYKSPEEQSGYSTILQNTNDNSNSQVRPVPDLSTSDNSHFSKPIYENPYLPPIVSASPQTGTSNAVNANGQVEEDLGFGNSKPRPPKSSSESLDATDSTKESSIEGLSLLSFSKEIRFQITPVIFLVWQKRWERIWRCCSTKSTFAKWERILL